MPLAKRYTSFLFSNSPLSFVKLSIALYLILSPVSTCVWFSSAKSRSENRLFLPGYRKVDFENRLFEVKPKK